MTTGGCRSDCREQATMHLTVINEAGRKRVATVCDNDAHLETLVASLRAMGYELHQLTRLEFA